MCGMQDSTITVSKKIKKRFNIMKAENSQTSNELLSDLMGDIKDDDKELMREAAALLWVSSQKLRKHEISEVLPDAMNELHYRLSKRIEESENN